MRRLSSPWLNLSSLFFFLVYVVRGELEQQDEHQHQHWASVKGSSVRAAEEVVFVEGVAALAQQQQQQHQQWNQGRGCREATRWPTFCSSLLQTSILNETSRVELVRRTGMAVDMFCDMVRVIDRIDCAQPFTVSPTWRSDCQDSYRDWTCALLTHSLTPLHQCDSTCHQVIRSCPYTTPDRSQVDRSGRPQPHPSQYGGHPTFSCPSTHQEEYFFTPTPETCIIFNPSEAGISSNSFPITTLDLTNINFTYCHEMSGVITADDVNIELGVVNVTHCCWTYASALPLTRSGLASTLKSKMELELENCVGVKGLEFYNPVVMQCFIREDDESEFVPSMATMLPGCYVHCLLLTLVLPLVNYLLGLGGVLSVGHLIVGGGSCAVGAVLSVGPRRSSANAVGGVRCFRPRVQVKWAPALQGPCPGVKGGGPCCPGVKGGGPCCPGVKGGGPCCPGVKGGGPCCPGVKGGGPCCPGVKGVGPSCPGVKRGGPSPAPSVKATEVDPSISLT